MPFTGRYHLVRHWYLPTDSIGPPVVLDRHDKTLRPYLANDVKHEWESYQRERECVRKFAEWKNRLRKETDPRRAVRMAERFMGERADCAVLSAFFDKSDIYSFRLFFDVSLSTVQTTTLSSNYVAGTSGAACAHRYLVPVGGKTINNVYFNIASFTGTASNVNDINLELRPEASAGAATPDTATLTESKTFDPASTTGWNKSTGWTSVLSALARVFFIVGDADGNGTDNAVINRSFATFQDYGVGIALQVRGYPALTTGGWASGNSVIAGPCLIVLAFSDGTAFGCPFTVGSTPGNDTNRRGLRITSSGLIANLPIYGMTWTSGSASISGMEIYNNANNPGTSPDNTSTDILYSSTAAARTGCLTSGGTPYTLVAGTAYRIVDTNSGANNNGPQRMDIGTGEDATLRSAMPGAGNFYYARANGTTNWSNDLVGSMPQISLLVDGQVAPASGGRASIIGS